MNYLGGSVFNGTRSDVLILFGFFFRTELNVSSLIGSCDSLGF